MVDLRLRSIVPGIIYRHPILPTVPRSLVYTARTRVRWYSRTHGYTCARAHINTNKHTHTHTHTRARTHARTHALKHTIKCMRACVRNGDGFLWSTAVPVAPTRGQQQRYFADRKQPNSLSRFHSELVNCRAD